MSLEPFSVTSPKDEHPNRNNGKKNEDVGVFTISLPEGNDLVNRNNGNKQV
jgi:hypothetical protein